MATNDMFKHHFLNAKQASQWGLTVGKMKEVRVLLTSILDATKSRNEQRRDRFRKGWKE